MADAHRILTEVSRSVGPALHLDTTVAEVLTAMGRLVSFRGGSVCLVEDGLVRIVAASPAPSPEVLAARLPVGRGLAGRCVAQGEQIYSPHLDLDDRVDPELRRLGSNRGITSYLATPLVCLGRVIGLLQVDSPEPDAFDHVDRFLLQGLGAQVAASIESARVLEDLQRLEEQKQSFIQLVSHELRTPLTIAKGFVETLLSDADGVLDDEQTRFMLSRTDVALLRLEGLVEELLLMSQLIGGDLRPSPTTTRLLPLLEDVVASSVGPHQVSLDCDPDIELVTDPDLARRAVGAVVDNALKYAGDAEITGRGTSVVVRDHGPGIPADVLGREDERFARSSTNDTTTAGLGLGFALARTLCRILGGGLKITEPDGGGTEVHLTVGVPVGIPVGPPDAD